MKALALCSRFSICVTERIHDMADFLSQRRHLGRGVLDRFVDRLDVRVRTRADRRGPLDIGKGSCWNRGDFIFRHVVVGVAMAGLKSRRGSLVVHQESLSRVDFS